MAVVIETTLGDITVDLYLDQRPVTCLNFLKLCKMKYYNFNLFHTIRSGFIAQTGDPTGEGSGGQSVFGLLEGPEKRFFSGEKMPKIRHTDAGLLSMVGTGDMMIGSQFFFTLSPDLDSLDGIHCVIGEVTEGHDVLRKLNDVICDEGHRPYRDVRITHTVVLEDPFNDPLGLRAPSRSPSPSAERLKGGRIAPDEEIDETQGKSAAEIQEMIEEKEAKARATILEIVGDLPDADIAPPENVLFVCKLNPITNDDDLEIIFSRFGKIVSCEVIRDKKTGDSLQYAFIEFGDKKSCEDAYFKMDNVLIDDRRIHVDFSQSVSKMRWLGKGRGVKYFNDEEAKERERGEYVKNEKSRTKDDHRNHHNERNNHNNNKRLRETREDDTDRNRDREKRSDRHHRQEKEFNHRTEEKPIRKRSRSRSKQERSRNDRNNHSNDQNVSRNSERHVKDRRQEQEFNKNENNRNRDNSNTHRSRSSPSRERREEKSRDHKSRHERKYEKEIENSKLKHKNENAQPNKSRDSKKEPQSIEPRTPSPNVDIKKSKSSSKHGGKKIDKSKRDVKKKRKPSTSSDSSSDSSSSSSESSSSSDEDRKKKSLKRRKKKYSTSSTSSSDSSSTSSSSSSTESSTSSSSSSDDGKKKKSRKSSNKKKKL